MVGALHRSGCNSACRGAHFPVCEADHGIGLALRLAVSGCQGSCGIVPNEPASWYSGSSNIRQCLKCKHVASIPTKTMTKYRPISCATFVRFYVIDWRVLLAFVLYMLLLKRNRISQPSVYLEANTQNFPGAQSARQLHFPPFARQNFFPDSRFAFGGTSEFYMCSE